ncbi:DUF262 domain-containing protein [Pararhizobium gei]|uniref:DUF262 domain-containing protein n=1 Tax=Pararhizobium gei TaxID=1395951 RepID=UPI0023DA53D5|nr:DUF262 domain-containing protein [Rhizobium gei]
MKATLSPTSVADFCQDLIANKITVNRDYQRDDRVWSSYVKSYFVESILLEYPIPKIFLYVRYNLKTRTSTKEIVDGQQRSQALRLFYENKMRISTKVETEELRGKRYKDLDDRLQGVFLSYSLAIDEFTGVTEDEIRESFARMNVHNATLNSEELRNAKFQGPFKIFIFRMTRAFRELMLDAGIISRRDVIRMADTRLISDIVHIIQKGFFTTRPPDIDSLYREFNTDFPSEESLEKTLRSSFIYWHENKLVEFRRFSSKHVFYTLLCAVAERTHPGLVVQHMSADQRAIYEKIMGTHVTLDQLDASLRSEISTEDGDEDVGALTPDPSLSEFVAACAEKTNVAHQKLIRFSYFSSALQEYDSAIS